MNMAVEQGRGALISLALTPCRVVAWLGDPTRSATTRMRIAGREVAEGADLRLLGYEARRVIGGGFGHCAGPFPLAMVALLPRRWMPIRRRAFSSTHIIAARQQKGNPPFGRLPLLHPSARGSHYLMAPSEHYPPALVKPSMTVPKVCSTSHSGLTSHPKKRYRG